jgi:acetoacetyl-CoA synthetase
MTKPAAKNDALTPLWKPSLKGETRLEQFMKYAACIAGQDFPDYKSLHKWSVAQPDIFWNAAWDFCGVIGDKGKTVIGAVDHVPWARFFPKGKINYAENALAQAKKTPDAPAIIARAQGGPDRLITWKDLYEDVSQWEQFLLANDVGKNDRVGVYLSNVPETIIILLAASNIGAVFASAGMEMGPDDLINRFQQVQPKILITAKGYIHGTKRIDRTEAIERVKEELPGIKKIVFLEDVEKSLSEFVPQKITFKRHAFNHPLYILFSSGTTGKPKCFEHSTGGVLLKHVSEHQLHGDIREGDRLFYHATPSWMMWNWLVSGLVNRATVLMYDGNPAYPDAYAQWNFTAAHRCTHHGSAAPVILSWEAAKISPAKKYDLSHLRAVMSTGAVLPPQGFHFIHEHIKQDVKINSLSGGTDMVGIFIGGNPITPTYAGQINGPTLGVDIQVWDEDGNPLPAGKAGELVCSNAFPSMPLRFLDDEEGVRYEEEYFNFYPGRKVWRHGDSVEKTAEGQFVIIGRSDATLNQNGVRIGPGTIYAQLGAFKDQIRDFAAVDFTRPDNKQAITVLFLAIHGQTNGRGEVPEALQSAIRKAVKDNITPYAIPTEIIGVPDVLKTPNGKKAEVVMKKIINGKGVANPTLYGEELVRHFEEIGRGLTDKYSA